jgi:homoserine kinase
MTTRHARVRVPASTSNLGAGFDCVGLAVDCWLTASATVQEAGGGGRGQSVVVNRAGRLAVVTLPSEQDLLYRGFQAACQAAGVSWSGDLTIDATSEIPVGYGLGSSAAAVVAGALLANATLGLALPRERLVEIGAGIDGHPDNVAPALYGGCLLVVRMPGGGGERGGGLHVTVLVVAPQLEFLIALPPFPSDTKAARAALPATVPFKDAALAVSRAAALVQGLATGDGTLLALALEDVLHVPYRRAGVPGYDEVVRAARAAGAYGATLSGAGSGVLAIAPRAAADQVGRALLDAWRAVGITAELLRFSRPAAGASVLHAPPPHSTHPAPLATT